MADGRATDDNSVADLVLRARAGEQHAWNEIVERFAPLVWSICRRYRLSDADAADASQGTWVRLLEHIATIDEPAALPGWIITTTVRECLGMLRTNTARGRRETDAAREQAAPTTQAVDVAVEEHLMALERHEALRAALEQLPVQCRRLIELLAADPPLSYAEIGRRLDLSVGGLGPTRGRCLQKLRRTEPLASLIAQLSERETGDAGD